MFLDPFILGRIKLSPLQCFLPLEFMIGNDSFLGFFLSQKIYFADQGHSELVILLLASVLEHPLKIFCLIF